MTARKTSITSLSVDEHHSERGEREAQSVGEVCGLRLDGTEQTRSVCEGRKTRGACLSGMKGARRWGKARDGRTATE